MVHRLPGAFCRAVFVVSSFAALLFQISCGGSDGTTRVISNENVPPRISGVFVNPDRVHAAQEILVSVGAHDEDGDRLRYFWTASRGTFPNGRGLPVVLWKTADSRAVDTLRVMVWDFQDTVSTEHFVSLHLPAPPTELRTINAARLADLEWSDSVDEGIDHWAGYEVYGAETSLAETPEEELAQYKLNEEFVENLFRYRVSGLDPLKKYYFHVRSVRAYGDAVERSLFTEEVEMSPRPSGLQSGFGEVGGSVAMGYDLSGGGSGTHRYQLDPDTATGAGKIDFYLGTTEEEDGGGSLALKSISLLAYRNPAWGDREVLIKPIGDDWEINTTDDTGWSTEAEVALLGVYAMKLPEGNYAKVRVTGITGVAPRRSIFIEWAYQNIPDYPSF